MPKGSSRRKAWNSRDTTGTRSSRHQDSRSIAATWSRSGGRAYVVGGLGGRALFRLELGKDDKVVNEEALLVEPVLHWTLFNIPATVTRLEPGMTPTGNPPGSSYGPNISGPARPYLGPRTPPGPKHPYHFQVFALDRTLPGDSIDTFTTLLELAKGHVLASGELVGLGSADAQ